MSMEALGAPQGALQVTSPANLEKQLAQQATDKAAASQQLDPSVTTQLAGYIRGQFEIFRNHRNTSAGWSERLLVALRAFNGQYDASKIQEIRRFGGSEVYARIIANKCRGASSLLRDVYLGPDRPWGITPPADPDIPDEITQKIDSLVQMEQQQLAGSPQAPSPEDFDDRRRSLLEAARDAAIKKAVDQAGIAEDKIEDMLREGGLYDAFAEFLVDLPIFPFACIKGPVVRIIPKLNWPKGGGAASMIMTPILTWSRVSPFDFWFTPGVADIESANTIEKLQVTRADLNDLLDLPGFNTDEIRAVLDEYGRGGLYDNWDTTDAERAVLESRENPAWNRSGMIAMMEFNGNVQGRILQEYGIAVPDELRDYNIQAWMIGSHIVKAQLNVDPRQRHPYFITSYEKVPGTPVGNSLVDILQDLQESANATLRALINNLSISSGPQVVVNDERLAPDESGEDMYPWKRWHVRSDPASGSQQEPISFFMPTSNAQTLLEVYKALSDLADDISAIPKYVGGSAGGSGAGRTASGLAMLMGNASKLLQTVSANIDRDVWQPLLSKLLDLILLTDTSGLLTGEEKISVMGVNVAIQRETQRQRQLEFLAHTTNPVDMKIMGITGRGKTLRAVSQTIGLDGEDIIPNDDKLEKMQQIEENPPPPPPPAELAVEQGIVQGVDMGVKKVVAEVIAQGIGAQVAAGVAAAQMMIPHPMLPGQGPPVGPAPPPMPGQGPPGAGAPPGASPPGGGMHERAKQAQGHKAHKFGHEGGPQTNVVGQPPGPQGPGGPGPQIGAG